VPRQHVVDADLNMAGDRSLAAEDAAFAPARQLGHGKRAGSVRRHMSAVEVDLVYVAGARAAQDWSLSGGDAAEGVVVDAACHAAMSAMKGAIFVEAVARAHVRTVAFDRWTWVATLVACYA
jgi:predicted DCC family thiol-disulfide oxidoreductase YuxK